VGKEVTKVLYKDSMIHGGARLTERVRGLFEKPLPERKWVDSEDQARRKTSGASKRGQGGSDYD